MWKIGVDVGGTFTDLFGYNITTGERVTSKVLTTHHDRTEGVAAAVRAAGIEFGDVNQLIHGTTTATNSLIERSFPDAAMITTKGFRDVLEIGRMHREFLYRPYQQKPEPLIRRRHRLTVPERIKGSGEVSRILDEEEARVVAKKITGLGIKSVAIGFINSYINSAHEERMREILLEENPDCFVVLSSETPVFREHGRFTTTAIRAVLMPIMASYLDDLLTKVTDLGFKGSLSILKSNGGLASVDFSRQHPEELVESGPAGGVAYASHLAKETGFGNILHTDVGGTSFDVSMVVDGAGLITRNYEIEWDVPLVVPMLDIHSVGAGGGSIAWVDDGGSLRVGPKSAGSAPGPACYGLGGQMATVTDANLLLNRLSPALGKEFELDREKALQAISPIGEEVGLEAFEAANAIVEIACETMAHAVKMVLNNRGRDPRDFVLASLGGAGPMHACFVAKALSIPKIVVPAYAGVASAFGATVMDLRHDLEAFYYSPVEDVVPAEINEKLRALEKQGRLLLENYGIAQEEMVLNFTAQMRYVGQTYEVTTPLPVGDLDEDALDNLTKSFHEQHAIEYGVSSEDFSPAIVSLGVAAIGKAQAISKLRAQDLDQSATYTERDVFFQGKFLTTRVYRAESLSTGHELDGPVIIESAHSCVVIPPGCHVSVDRYRNLIISIFKD